MEGGAKFHKKVSSQRITKRAHFSECINLPVSSTRKSERIGLNDVRGWGRESRLWESSPVGSSIEKASSLLLGPARLLSPSTMRGPPRPPAPWLPLLHWENIPNLAPEPQHMEARLRGLLSTVAPQQQLHCLAAVWSLFPERRTWALTARVGALLQGHTKTVVRDSMKSERNMKYIRLSFYQRLGVCFKTSNCWYLQPRTTIRLTPTCY